MQTVQFGIVGLGAQSDSLGNDIGLKGSDFFAEFDAFVFR
jgi:hypothetical protein